MRRLSDAFREHCRQAVEEIQAAVLEEAVQLSSGTATPQQLRRDDHPYARRHGRIRAPYHHALINRQSGAFAARWRKEPAEETAGGFEAAVVNDDPKGPWLTEGTPLMLERSLVEEIVLNTEERAARILGGHMAQMAREDVVMD